MGQRKRPESIDPETQAKVVGIGWTGLIMSGHVTRTISDAPITRLSPVTWMEACSRAVY